MPGFVRLPDDVECALPVCHNSLSAALGSIWVLPNPLHSRSGSFCSPHGTAPSRELDNAPYSRVPWRGWQLRRGGGRARTRVIGDRRDGYDTGRNCGRILNFPVVTNPVCYPSSSSLRAAKPKHPLQPRPAPHHGVSASPTALTTSRALGASTAGLDTSLRSAGGAIGDREDDGNFGRWVHPFAAPPPVDAPPLRLRLRGRLETPTSA